MSQNSFRYDIDFVVSLDLPDSRRYKAGQGYNIDCPFCGKVRKMNINPAKNVYSCPRCRASGGILALHKNLKGFLTTADAKADLEKQYDALSPEQKKAIKQGIVNGDGGQKYVNPHAADLSERDRVYRAWLSVLPLHADHIEELQSERRGWLTIQDIKRLGYKSYDEGNVFHKVSGNLSLPEYAMVMGGKMHYRTVPEKLQFYRLWFEKKYSTIPGFMFDKKKKRIISFREKGCLLIPVRSRHGEISFFQQKYPALPPDASEKQKEAYKKYGRYGSFGDLGCTTSGLECIHYSGFNYQTDKTPDSVWLTEGVLKADIASTISHKAFIALVGVNVHSQLGEELKYLKEHGTKRICVAVDMDYREKEAVSGAMFEICKKVIDAGLECQLMSWTEEYKGIDDFFIAMKKKTPGLQINNRIVTLNEKRKEK